MRRLGYRALALLTVASVLLLSPGRAAEQPETEFDGYLVRLSDPREWNGPVLLSAGTCEEVSDGLYRVEDLETAQAMDQLGMAEYYEPNYRLELLESGSYMPAQWNLLTVHAQTAWEHTDGQGAYDMRGTGVTVAVIDSGVYREHPDFKQEHILDYYDLAGTDDGVDVWHGTFVAGVIAAQVNNALGVDGVAPDVTILPICVTKNGGSDTALLIQAIDYAVKQGVDVINLSIGGKYGNESLKKACQDAVDAGILVIAAAGNYKSGETKSSACYMYPASYDGVVSVSACKQDGETVSFDSSYSHFNDRVTVAAPGTGVQSLYLDGGTATKQGTSFAAPVVTAMAAMAKQRSRAIAPETFAALLCGSAVDLGEAGYDLYYGFGLADIAAFAGALDRSYSVTYRLGAEDAAFAPGAQVPRAYALGPEDIPLPEPVRPGYRFLGWYETEDASGTPVGELPAGCVGDKTYYAAWSDVSTRYFAQYASDGRLLAVEQLPQGTDRIADVEVEIRDGAVLGSLFWVDETGAPLREAEYALLNGTRTPES